MPGSALKVCGGGGGWLPTHFKVKHQLQLRLSWAVTTTGKMSGEEPSISTSTAEHHTEFPFGVIIIEKTVYPNVSNYPCINTS